MTDLITELFGKYIIYRINLNGYVFHVNGERYPLKPGDLLMVQTVGHAPGALSKINIDGLWMNINLFFPTYYVYMNNMNNMGEIKLSSIDVMADDITVSWNRDNKLNELGI